jgi:hypothetical protein
VRSSRKLERECRRNVELMWLLRRLAPDFKTIADFRRENGPGIVGTCRAFVLFCREQGLFATRLVALDGSKFRAAASAKRIMGERDIAEEAARIDQRIAGYLADLDATDATETDDADAERMAAALVELKARRAELAALAPMLGAEHRTTLVEGEPDARSMGMGAGRKPPSYNVQAGRLTIGCCIRWQEQQRRQWKPIRSLWWRMRATPMGRTRPHASAMASRPACRRTGP